MAERRILLVEDNDAHALLIERATTNERVMEDQRLSAIPVVVLTTSASESDQRRAYALHANSYVVKPVNCRRFQRKIRAVRYYWTRLNQAPRSARRPAPAGPP